MKAGGVAQLPSMCKALVQSQALQKQKTNKQTNKKTQRCSETLVKDPCIFLIENQFNFTLGPHAQ
jgi:hypothetical protein